MSQVNVIRAWKDEEYRNSLSEAERARLPENPAGLIELADSDLADTQGGTGLSNGCYYTAFCWTRGCAPSTWNCSYWCWPFP